VNKFRLLFCGAKIQKNNYELKKTQKMARFLDGFWVLFWGKKGQKSGKIYCFQVIIIITHVRLLHLTSRQLGEVAAYKHSRRANHFQLLYSFPAG